MNMPAPNMDIENRKLLLQFARESLEYAVRGEPRPEINTKTLPDFLQQPGATFVTLTRNGELRGCIGTLEARQPLIVDVCEHAVAAGLMDYRFPPVQPEELKEIEIEISRLTEPVPLEYQNPEELLRKIRPGIDGVIIKDGWKRATFLPQVWEKLPVPHDFLDHLCQKMGAPPDLWRRKKIEVLTYEVEEFHDE